MRVAQKYRLKRRFSSLLQLLKADGEFSHASLQLMFVCLSVHLSPSVSPSRDRNFVKPKESAKERKNREKKAAKHMMDSLGGMKQIRDAERLERERKWRECIEAYEVGIEQLEESLKTLKISDILTPFQHKECQSQLDGYCRTLIKLQRRHNKDIERQKQLEFEQQQLAIFRD